VRAVREIESVNKDFKLKFPDFIYSGTLYPMEFDKEHAELILDKVHLAMSKKDPRWQEKILKGNEGELQQFHKLQRLALEQVIKSTGTEMSFREWEDLGNEFRELKAEDLSLYALGKAEWLKGKKDRLEAEKGKLEEKIEEEKDTHKSKPETPEKQELDKPNPEETNPEKEPKEPTKEKKKKQKLEEVQKGKKRAVGEIYTQPSGRRVKKVKEGLIVEVNEKGEPIKKEPNGKGRKPKAKKEAPEEGKPGKQKEPKGRSSLVESAKKGAEVVKETDKSVDETKGGGFAEQPGKVAEKAMKTPGKNEKSVKIAEKVKSAKGKSQDKKGTQGVEENPREIPFSQITTKEQYTDKKDYDKAQINQLKESIKENGFDPTFPIMVDKQGGKWTVVAGHHRYEAVKSLIEEGQLPDSFQIPVVTKNFASDNDRLAAQVLENQRRQVLPTDEAKAYKKMREQGWNPEKIAQKLGKTVGDVNKRLALTNLSKDLFSLVSKKDRTLPLGVAEVIGMFGVNDNGQPNETIQIRAFKWYQENKNKINTPGPVAVQSYIKELKSGDLNFDLEASMSDTQREALRSIGSAEKAQRNAKMIENMLKNLQGSYQRILGDSINDLNPETVKELSASIAAQGNVHTDKTMATIDAIIQDLSKIKEAFNGKIREIQGNASIPLMFSKLREILKRLGRE